MHIDWIRFAVWPLAILMSWGFGKLLAPISTFLRRHMRDGNLKRFLLTPAGSRWGTQLKPGDRTESTVLTDWNKRIVDRLPPPGEK